MERYVIIRSYSNYSGTFHKNECIVYDLELAKIAVDFYEKKNQQQLQELQDFNQVIAKWQKKNPEPIKPHPSQTKELEKYYDIWRVWKLAEIEFLKTRPQHDCDVEYEWIYEVLKEMTIEDFVQ